MSDERLEIQKRHTLNWLIQGAAQHAGMTFHHIVRDELNALDPRLLRYYDQYALINLLQYWQLTSAMVFGWPPRFWRRASSSRRHPFFEHPLLSKYGGMLAEAGRQRARIRAREKGLIQIPVIFSYQIVYIVSRLRALEAPYRPQLVRLAKRATSMVWGIPQERLDGDLRDSVVSGAGIPVRGVRDAIFTAAMVGYGGVLQRDDELIVISRGTNWQLLAKELVKGTAELICLHGINQWSDAMYDRILKVTDRLSLEPWMLQSGGELWRRLLASFPEEIPMAKVLMQLARLPAGDLESVLAEVLRQPEGKARLANLIAEWSKE